MADEPIVQLMIDGLLVAEGTEAEMVELAKELDSDYELVEKH